MKTKRLFLDFKLAVEEEIFDKYSSATCLSTRSSDASINYMQLLEMYFASHNPLNPKKKTITKATCCVLLEGKNGKKIVKILISVKKIAELDYVCSHLQNLS